MLDSHRLRLLKEFAERGTIVATPAARGSPPSAVSQQRAALEREAGVTLLDRTARSAELTDAGVRLAGHAERILGPGEEAAGAPARPGPGRGARVPPRRRSLRARTGPQPAGAPAPDPAAPADPEG